MASKVGSILACARGHKNGLGIRKLWWKNRESKKYSIVNPQQMSPQISPSSIPAHVCLPPYYISSDPGLSPDYPEIKSEESIGLMRESCALASRILRDCGKMVAQGVTTDQIDQFVTQAAFENGAYPSPLNYRNFPKSVCTSVNNCVCHGIPDNRPLENGDIINVDITVYLNHHHGDCSATFKIGDVDDDGVRLVDTARECLYEGLAQCGPGKPFSKIGTAVEKHAAKRGFKVVPAFTGHGIGKYFHGPPDIFHCRNYYPGVMKPGMVFTVEPAISEGTHEIVILEDGWTALTEDDSRSAQFEHTILITQEGIEILTSRCNQKC